MTTAVDSSDQLIAFVYVSLCGQRGSRDVERTSAPGHRHVTTLARGPAYMYVAGHRRAGAVERQVWRRAAAERAASSMAGPDMAAVDMTQVRTAVNIVVKTAKETPSKQRQETVCSPTTSISIVSEQQRTYW